MLGGLADVVAAESVDVVLVAGDVYDRAVPSADATGCARAGWWRGCAAPARRVVLTPGNHDSARRLGIFSGLLAAGGVHVRAETPAARRAGPARRRARRRRDLRPALPRAGGRPHELGLPGARAATRRCWPRRWTGCGPTCSCGPAPGRWCWRTPSSAAAQPSDSERDICVGGVDLVPAVGVRRRRLRRPRPPAPAADAHAAAALQRLAAGLLLLRGRAAEAGLAGRPRRRAGSPTSGPVPLPVPRPLACSPAPRRAARRPGARRAPRSTSSPPGSPTPSARPTRCAGCRPGSRTASTWSGPAARRRPTAAATRSGCAAAATSTSPGSSSATCAACRPRAGRARAAGPRARRGRPGRGGAMRLHRARR